MNSSAQQPMIVKYLESLHNGIQSQILSRYAIGYILRGTKYIYDGDKRQTLARGDVFYLGLGHHYIENVPDGSQPYEEVLFYYTPEDLQRILMHLNITYGLNISNEHSCENCRNRTHVAMPAWNSLRNFFVNTNNYLRDEEFRHDETAENIKMTELIYLIASHEDCCIKSKLLSNVDAAKENFEQIVYDHIFKDISIEELARLTHRSLTSFKKEFRRHFQMPPPQMVHPPAADAFASAVDFDLEIDLRDRQRMHLPQHLALHQTLQEGVPDDSGNLPPPPPELPNGRGSGSCRRRGSRAGKGCGKRRGTLIKNLRTERKLKNLNYNMV